MKKNINDLLPLDAEETKFHPILKDSLKSLDNEEMPSEAFMWKQAVQEEKSMQEKKENRKKPDLKPWMKWIAAAAAFVIIAGGTLATREHRTQSVRTTEMKATGAALYREAPKAGSYLNGTLYETADMDDAVAEEAAAVEISGAYEEKIIRTVSFTLKTTEYEADLDALLQLTERVGGRTENMSVYGDASNGESRTANITLRVPQEKLDVFLTDAGKIGTAQTNYSENRQDVSENYYDTETRLSVQRAKLARLEAMLPAAKTVGEIIEIEEAISDAQYYVDLYEGRIRNYDSRISYSTVSVRLVETRQEVQEEPSFIRRVVTGLRDSLQNGMEFLEDMAIFLVSLLPWLAAVVLIVLIGKALYGIRRKKQVEKQKKEDA